MSRPAANLQVSSDIGDAVRALTHPRSPTHSHTRTPSSSSGLGEAAAESAVAVDSNTSRPIANLLVLTVDPAAAKVSLLRSAPVSPTHGGTRTAGSGIEAAFPVIHDECAAASAPRLFLVQSFASADAESFEWLIVSYVPDTTHPKHKMVYASARDDVRKALDEIRSARAYHVTELDELKYDVFASWRDRSDRESAMSNWELQKAAVARESEAARRMAPGRLPGMGAVPFSLSQGVLEVLQQLAPLPAPAPEPAPEEAAPAAEPPTSPRGEAAPSEEAEAPAEEALTSPPRVAAPSDEAAASPTRTPMRTLSSTMSFVELAVSGETLDVVTKETGAPKEVTEAVDRIIQSAGKEPRYFALRVASSPASPAGAPTAPRSPTALVYYCPEDSAPRSRMKYSTAKAALLEGASNAGVTFSRVVEAHDKADLTSALEELASGTATPDIKSPGAGAARTAGSSMPRSPLAGAFALPGMGSPLKSPSSAGASGSDNPSEVGFDKPARPARARVPGGMALPGMGVALPGMGMALPGLTSPK